MISNVLALTHHGPLAAIAILSNRGSRHLKPCALVPKSAKSEIKNASVVTPFYTLTFAQATKKTLPSLRHWLRTLPQHEVQAEPVSLLDAVHASAWATPKSAYGVWKPSAVCTVNAVDIQLDFESPEPPEVPLYQPRTVVVRNPRWHVPGTTEVAVSVPVMNFDIGLLLNRKRTIQLCCSFHRRDARFRRGVHHWWARSGLAVIAGSALACRLPLTHIIFGTHNGRAVSAGNRRHHGQNG